MMCWIVGIIAYLLIAFEVYNQIISKWEGHKKWEKIWFSVLWPCTGIAFIIKKIFRPEP